jgi:DHA1 family quinolone resistance protein-like MFS transporter
MKSPANTSGLHIYFFPAMIDLVMGVLFFVNPVRLARMGASFSLSAGVVTAWGCAYMASCQVAGRLTTEQNAARLMIGACFGLALLTALFILLPSVLSIYILMALSGVACAFFFTPFQVFMKSVDAGSRRPLSFSTGMYTFSWSLGIALGPLLAGPLMELGPPHGPWSEPVGLRYCFAIAGVASLATAFAIVRFLSVRMRRGAQLPRSDTHGMVANGSYRRMPDLAWLGWICAGFGGLVLAVLRGIFPKAGLDFGLSESTIGHVVFLMCLMQSLTGLALSRSRLWMYRSLPVATFALAGIAGLLLFGLGRTVLPFYIGAALFGIYSGSFFFYVVFHSLAHPSRSARYVSIHESIFGATGTAGPLIGGFLADSRGYGFPLIAAAIAGGLVLVFQFVSHARNAVRGGMPAA